ncbi:biopolymer transporter ExbD [Aquirhabdus parva]|uniref:Biopolymer transporter ExbD n=2 Tax=Moraxellaceae TaxID=468 RepID=A0A345PB19_9GAMM|nr:biopolymer transporter ExbD [Aquirhabdus parva]
MNVGSGSSQEDDVMLEVNMTPLIDVMLVLIIMLIITIPIQNHAIKMDNPIGDPPPPSTPPLVVNVDIDAAGTILWNGAQITSRADLESKLHSVATKPDQDEVHLRPNKATEFKSVAMIMASAQRLGVTKIGIVGNEQYMP